MVTKALPRIQVLDWPPNNNLSIAADLYIDSHVVFIQANYSIGVVLP